VTTVSEQTPERTPSLADTAAEPIQESVEREREALGDEPEGEGLVPDDKSQ